MPDKFSKSELIAQRRKKILELLEASNDGKGEYTYIKNKLQEQGFKAGDRTVRDDCKYLSDQGCAVSVKKGAAITDRGRMVVGNKEDLEEEVKEKYLKQLAILKCLYDCEMRTDKSQVKGMLPVEIANLQGIGEEDTVRDILHKMAREGLVHKDKDGERWRLSANFPRPVPVDTQTATMLYEYLNTVSGLLTLSPDLSLLKSKIAPLLMLPRREQWREELAKLAERITVHGKGAGEQQDIYQLMALVEEAVYKCRAINAVYKGRELKIYPLGVVYHWEKGQWYVVAKNSSQKNIVPYLLSRLTNVQVTGESFVKPVDFDMEGFLEKRWGISSDQELEVKIRFENTSWHRIALEKLRADVMRRRICSTYCHFEEQEDGSIILYDKVRGLSEFASWLRSFGDAAEVLEPEALRRKMAETGRRMLERYGQGGVFSEQ